MKCLWNFLKIIICENKCSWKANFFYWNKMFFKLQLLKKRLNVWAKSSFICASTLINLDGTKEIKRNKSNNKRNWFECFWLDYFVFFNCTPIQFSEMEPPLLSLVIQNWYFIHRYNLLQIHAQVCLTWTFCNFKTYLDCTLPHLSYYRWSSEFKFL